MFGFPFDVDKNVQTELHEHFYGDKSAVFVSFAGRISYMPIDQHKLTICGIYDNPNVFRTYLCTNLMWF